MRQIKNIITMVCIKYKHNPNKLKYELDNIRDYIHNSNFYTGNKKKLYKHINCITKNLNNK